MDLNIHSQIFNSLGTTEEFFIKDSEVIYTSGHRTAWKEQLLKLLSKYCGCATVVKKENNIVKYSLAGKPRSIRLMKMLWVWLSFYIRDNANKAFASGKIAVNSYCLGYLKGLEESIIANTPSFVFSLRESEEAKFFVKMSQFDNHEVPECNHFHTNQLLFKQGYLDGNELKL